MNVTRDIRPLHEKYKLVGKIGEGTYGLVYKAEIYNEEEKKNEDCAIKVMKSHREGKHQVVLSMATLREVKILKELRHENIVRLFDVHVDPREQSLALVFEYAHHDLRDIIVQSKHKPLSEFTRKSLMHQILKGVKYMHDNWIMHRDMKPQNILVVGGGRKRGHVKIADFGLARIYQAPIKCLSEVERVVVTLWYRAPELLLGTKHYTKAVDMWSTGCIFAEMVNTRELFCGKEVEGTNAPFQKDQLDRIFRLLGMPTPQSWPGLERLPEYKNLLMMQREKKYPKAVDWRKVINPQIATGENGELLRDLLRQMLELNPEKRITAEKALEHKYFKQDPEPRNWAFDEPKHEPVQFKHHVVQPIPENQHQGRSKGVGAHGQSMHGKPRGVPGGMKPPVQSNINTKRPYDGGNSRNPKQQRHR